jgi:hypothetical protein
MRAVPINVHSTVAHEAEPARGARLERKRPPAAVITTISVIRGFVSAATSRHAIAASFPADSACARGFCIDDLARA